VAAVVAAVAEAAAAEAAGVAEVAAVAAVAVAGVCPGVLAASAKPDHFPNTLTDRSLLAGFDEVDPANPCFLACGPPTRGSAAAMTAEWVPNLVEKYKRPNWSNEIPWSENTPIKTESERQADCAG
jgi:hypothetical protein